MSHCLGRRACVPTSVVVLGRAVGAAMTRQNQIPVAATTPKAPAGPAKAEGAAAGSGGGGGAAADPVAETGAGGEAAPAAAEATAAEEEQSKKKEEVTTFEMALVPLFDMVNHEESPTSSVTADFVVRRHRQSGQHACSCARARASVCLSVCVCVCLVVADEFVLVGVGLVLAIR